MNYRTLGKTGLPVSELAMGGLFVSSYGAEREEARRAVRRALELGVNYVDTAPSYRDSEEALGYALDGVTQPYILSTKLGGRPQPFDPRDKDALRRSVEDSLRLLKRGQIDILMIHEPDRPGQYDWFSDPERFHGPVCDLLDELKAEGVIRFTGLGGTTAYELPHIINTGRYDVVLTAFNYSLLWREALIEVIPAATRQGMGIVIGSPLQQGALARRYDDEVYHGARWLSSPRREQYKRLYALLDELEMPIAELGLRFVLSNPAISTVLMGARSVAEVEANVAAAEKGPLPAEVLARIDEIAARVPFRPFEEPFGLPFGRPGRHGPGVAR
ncbi:MAG: aldo/keto reductase [Caldilineaceae bacterium]|nr:aldo/keto reductase [Caldilineaceae bacterium]